jgi:hypothetical protein
VEELYSQVQMLLSLKNICTLGVRPLTIKTIHHITHLMQIALLKVKLAVELLTERLKVRY